MIKIENSLILISTNNTSLILNVDEVKKVNIVYYANKIESLLGAKSLIRTYPYIEGCEVSYDKNHNNISLNRQKNIVSTVGKGDNFSPSLSLKRDDCSVFDFIYDSFTILNEYKLDSLPTPHDYSEVGKLTLKETKLNILLNIYFFVYADCDVIGVSEELINNEEKDILINKISSLQLPLVNEDYELITTFGCWAGELNVQKEKVTRGKKVIESLCGYSSNRHNPSFLIREGNCSFNSGNVYGFNLVYSGNFENSIEMDAFENIRIQLGISSYEFNKVVKQKESFTSPMAVMTYTDSGINSMSFNFHRFVNQHVIEKQFYKRNREIVYNNWEATSFNFTESKIHSLMKKASKLGVELFVLDDGWFSTRNNDTSGLGDWNINTKKLPSGLKGLSDYAKKLNMKFGLWMEPEMVNEDSELYRNHPDYVISDNIHEKSYGRNQLVLDLSKKEVQDYVYKSVFDTLKSADISYLKWDCNRNITDYLNKSGTFFFDYITGLYSVLEKLRKDFPDVLFENCASGGNRFDLGMLSYFAQSWQSDDTDSYQRIYIQEGAGLFYPLSTLSNHVACKVSNQMLRYTYFDTKFNVACFGVLGYELDLDDLSKLDIENIKAQIAYYKEHRDVFQWGRFYTDSFISDRLEKIVQVKNESETIVARYQTIQKPFPKEAHLKAFDLDKNKLYEYTSRKEMIPLKKFGGLINYVSPIHINPEGSIITVISKYKGMDSEVDSGICYGSSLMSTGPVLSQEWSGVGYDERVRFVSDFGARIYLIKEYTNDLHK